MLLLCCSRIYKYHRTWVTVSAYHGMLKVFNQCRTLDTVFIHNPCCCGLQGRAAVLGAGHRVLCRVVTRREPPSRSCRQLLTIPPCRAPPLPLAHQVSHAEPDGQDHLWLTKVLMKSSIPVHTSKSCSITLLGRFGCIQGVITQSEDTNACR